MNNRPLLSICIPTYQRAEKLKQCLDYITCQFNDNQVKNLIEIVVSDNASQDSTAEIVRKFQNSFDNIRYFRNETNVGIDKNIINSIVKAQGKYCWSIGDDDFAINGSLKFLVNFLANNDVALLTIDYRFFTNTDEISKEEALIPESLVTYANSAEDFYKKGYCQGTLGIFVFLRDEWLKIDRSSYEEFWGYYEIILRILPVTSLKLAHLNYPVLLIGRDYRWNGGGTGLFTFINAVKTYKKLAQFGYSKTFVQQEKDRMSKNLFNVVLSAKSFGLPSSLKNMRLIYQNFKEYPLQVFLTTLVFFLPNILIKTAKDITKK